MNEELKDLIIRSQKQDQQAYLLLLNKVEMILTAYFHKRLSRAEDVQEVVQNSLLKIHRSLGTYSPDYPFEPWMFAIAKNTLNDFLRKSYRNQSVDLSDINEPEANEVESEHKLQFEQAWSSLTVKQQEALTLTKFEGLSIEQASHKTKTSVTAFKARVHKAMKAFKKEFFYEGS